VTGIRIKVDDSAILAALRRVEQQDGGLVVASLKVIGQAMLRSTRKRFETRSIRRAIPGRRSIRPMPSASAAPRSCRNPA
jgi:hypothetical protein